MLKNNDEIIKLQKTIKKLKKHRIFIFLFISIFVICIVTYLWHYHLIIINNYVPIKLITMYNYIYVIFTISYNWIDLGLLNINKVFNNRELALGIWIIILLIYMLAKKEVRKSLFNIFKIAFNKKFILLYICMSIYTALIVYVLYIFNFWEVSLLKDTIIWFLFTGVISAFRAIDKANDINYFKIIIKDNIKILLILEFIVNFYTFSILGELVLIPVIIFIALCTSILDTMPEFQNEKSIPTKKLFSYITFILGAYIILNSIFLAIKDFKNLETINALKSLLLPSILSIFFIIFIYLFALWSGYEQIFIRIKFGTNKSESLIRYTKFKIFILCHLNFNRVKSFWKISGISILNVKNKSDVLGIIDNFRAQINIKK